MEICEVLIYIGPAVYRSFIYTIHALCGNHMHCTFIVYMENSMVYAATQATINIQNTCMMM